MNGFAPVDPKQSFPALEQSVLERWRERDVFGRSLANRADAPLWSFYEGPPTANGLPGSHHVLSRVFKDIYPRYRTMTGHRVPRKAGWDCHGLPVELEVEKELGISSKSEIEEFGIAEFNERCRESVFRYVEEWNRMTERVGFWVDLDDPYVTMTDDYIESCWWALRKIWDEGRLYEGHKVVPYCPRCGTALSSHEVALGYHDVTDPSAYVLMPVREPAPSDQIPESPIEPGDALLAWTTTPWTLISNAAIAAGPEIEYVRARAAGSDRVVVVAAALLEKVLGEGAEILAHFPGEALAGTTYEPPFDYITDYGPNGHTVLLADFVTTDDGTGLVHTAIAFGEDDFQLGERYGITLQNPVRLDGTFDERVTDFAGRNVKEADADIVAELERRGRLLRSEDYLHSYPHCWRCDTPLLYYAKASWYVATSQVRDQMLANNAEIGWHPEHIRDGRFGKWLEGNVDWALSRDRYWGTPLPIWKCTEPECDAVFCAGSLEDIRERGGEIPDDLHRPHIDGVEIDCSAEGCSGRMRRDPAVIDTWFDSGAMPFAQFHYPFENAELFEERFPADFICEAIDQTRGWFYTLLAESTLLFDTTSYRNCVCLGLILDPDGQKMSKSKGNVVQPWDVFDAHGADALRWYYLTAQQPWTGYRFSADTVGESVRQFMLTLWNTYGFWVLYANTEGLTPKDFNGPSASPAPASQPRIPAGEAEEMRADGEAEHDVPVGGAEEMRADGEAEEDVPEAVEGMTELDRWALSRLQGVVATCRDRLDDFDCTTAGQAIAEYVDELSNWYVRLNRRRFWAGDRAAFATLRHCLIEVAKLLAPFTPFIADEIHLNLTGGAAGLAAEPGGAAAPEAVSVHLADYPEPVRGMIDGQLEAGVEAVQRTVELGRAARAAAKVKMRQPLRKAVVVASPEERVAIERLVDVVAAELNVKQIEFVSDESELVSHSVKPNYRSLGPRFGKSMPNAAAAVEALDAGAVREALSGGGEVGISVDGSDHTITPEDVNLVMEPLDGYEVEAEQGHAVALSVELDDELVAEGLAREVVRAVQNARKESGLDVSDRIELELGGDEPLLRAARAHSDYISAETLADAIAFEATDGIAAKIEDHDLVIGLSRA